MFAAGVSLGGFSQASAADWYYIDADADDAAWFIDNSSVYKTDECSYEYLLKLTMKASHTSTQYASIAKEKHGQNLITTVYRLHPGVALLSSKGAQNLRKLKKIPWARSCMRPMG